MWQLHFDDAGFGCCIANDPSRGPVCVEDLFTKMVFLSTGGTYLVADKAFPERAIDLSTFAAKHEELTLVLLIGPSKSKKTLDAALVRWPRPPNGRLLISLTSCYHELGLDQFNGQAWRWIFSGFKKWETHLATMGLQKHIDASAYT